MVRVGAEVQAEDDARGGSQIISYDWLVVATGATHNYFGKDAWAAHAPGLKSLADAQELRGRILDGFEIAESSADPRERRKALTFVVVGGGPTGVELAGSIAELAAQTLRRDFCRIDPAMASVRLFEAGPRILPAFPDDLASDAQRKLAELGVTVDAGTPILDIGPDGVRTAEGLIEARAVIWTAGVKATAAARMLSVPADRGGRIAVDDTLRLPDDPAVFVLGDIALVEDASGRPLPGLAQVARQQGQHVAATLRLLMAGGAAAPFRYRDLGSWAIVGRNAAVAVVGGRKLRGRIAWLAWGLIHIALLVGFENRFRVLLKWMWEYLTRRRSARLIVTAARRKEEVRLCPDAIC
jgi:NADH dehydrogenase